MSSQDYLYRYLFNDAHVRGELVQLEKSYQDILNSYQYPPVIQQLLGELMAASCLLTATLKFEGEIALQVQSEGAVKYAIINGTHDQKMRGVARWDEQLRELPDNFQDLFHKGVLAITITPDEGERYQGMVALDKPTLAECIQDYFEQSEQLTTFVTLETSLTKGAEKAGGMLLQVLPTSSESTKVDEDHGFEHLVKLTETITPEELLGLPGQDVLYRLYHDEEVEVFEPQSVQFKCTCSRERSASAIANVDKAELLDILAKEGEIKINCQFCHAEYRFDAIDVEAIHAGGSSQSEVH